MSRQPSAASGSAALLTSFAAIAVINYAFAITMSWLLPVEGYGILGISQAIMLLGATVVSAGIPWALTAETAARGDKGLGRWTLMSGLLANSLLAFALGGAVALSAASGVLRLGSDAEAALVAAGAAIAVLGVNSAALGVIHGSFRLGRVALARAVEVIVKALAGIALVGAGLGALGAVLGFVAGAAVSTSLALAWLRGAGPFPVGGPGLRTLAGRAAPLFVGVSAFAFLSQADVLLLRAFAGPGEGAFLTGQYQAAVTLARLPWFAGLALFGAVFPYVSRHAGHPLAAGYAQTALRLACLGLVPFAVVLATIPEATIAVFFSERYESAAAALRLSAIAAGMLTVGLGVGTVLQAAGRATLVAVVVLLAAVAQVAMAALLVPAAGMAGTAAALAVAGVLVLAILWPAAARTFRLHVRAADALMYVGSLGTLVVVLRLLPTGGRPATIATTLIALSAYGVAITMTGLLTSEDARTITGAAGSVGRRAGARMAAGMDAIRVR